MYFKLTLPNLVKIHSFPLTFRNIWNFMSSIKLFNVQWIYWSTKLVRKLVKGPHRDRVPLPTSWELKLCFEEHLKLKYIVDVKWEAKDNNTAR